MYLRGGKFFYFLQISQRFYKPEHYYAAAVIPSEAPPPSDEEFPLSVHKLSRKIKHCKIQSRSSKEIMSN